MSSDSRAIAVVARYRDAYRVADGIIALGNTIKVLGAVIATLIVIVAFAGMSTSDEPGRGGVAVLIGGGLLAAFVGMSLWSVGVLISAQGQLLLASLDGAVYLSPFITDAQRAQVMSLAQPVSSPSHLPSSNGAVAYQPEILSNNKVKCWKCGKTNNKEQTNCWDCYTRLYERDVQA